MRRTILLLVVTAAVIASYAGTAASQTSPSETLDANNLPKVSSPQGLGLLTDYGHARAQTFTATNSGALTSAQIQMYKQCDEAGDVRMQIATVDDSSGFPTNNILSETATLPASTFVTDDGTKDGVGDLVTVTFSDPAQVEAGQKYALIIRHEAPTYDDCGFYPYLFPLKLDVYPGGSSAFLRTQDGWLLNSEYDHVFAIYVTLPSGPTSKADCKKGGYKEFGFEKQGRCIASVNRAVHGQ